MKSLEQTVRGINAARSNRSFYPIIRTFKKTASFEYESFLLRRFWLRLRWDTVERPRCKDFGTKTEFICIFYQRSKLSRSKIIYLFFNIYIYVVTRELFSQIHFYIKIILPRLNKLRTNSYQLIKISSFIRFETS